MKTAVMPVGGEKIEILLSGQTAVNIKLNIKILNLMSLDGILNEKGCPTGF